MYSLALVPLGFALLDFARAQTTEIPFFLLDTDRQSLVASVIDVQASSTTFMVGCPPGTDASDCGYNPPMRVTQAANYAAADITMEGAFTFNWQCSITSSTAAVCTESAGGPEANFPGVTTETLSGTDVQYFPVTVTAGLEKLTTNGGVADTTTTATNTGATGTTGASKTTQNTQSSPTTSSSTSVPNPSNSDSAAERIGQNSGLLAVLAGIIGLLL